MDEQDEPFGWWGWHWQPAIPLSVMQIIEAGSTDTGLMALVWAMLQRRASVLVAAEPPMAGKTTTLTALLDLLPPNTHRVYLRGYYETFEFTRAADADPPNTYVLANEMSDHLAVYIWGSRIYKMFELIDQGYAIGSTMHAETVEDVVAILNSDPLRVPPSRIANLTLVINLYVSSTHGRGVRRFNWVHLLGPGNEDGSQFLLPGVEPLLLSHWDRPTGSFDHRYMQPEIVAKLAEWAKCTPEEWSAEVAERKAYLDELQAEHVLSVGAVKDALERFEKK